MTSAPAIPPPARRRCSRLNCQNSLRKASLLGCWRDSGRAFFWAPLTVRVLTLPALSTELKTIQGQSWRHLSRQSAASLTHRIRYLTLAHHTFYLCAVSRRCMVSERGSFLLSQMCIFIFQLGRLADILGRKGAMLLALALFGMRSDTPFSDLRFLTHSLP